MHVDAGSNFGNYGDFGNFGNLSLPFSGRSCRL
jgi:hypothetical protein